MPEYNSEGYDVRVFRDFDRFGDSLKNSQLLTRNGTAATGALR